MKQLFAKLASLIPKENYSSTDAMTQLGSLDEAAKYIKNLKERVDELRQRKSSALAMATLRGTGGISMPTTTTTSGGAGSSELEAEKAREALAPLVEVRQHDDSSLDVVLICSLERPIKLHEVITVLEEEGAEIVNANHSVAGLKIFYTIHSQISLYIDFWRQKVETRMAAGGHATVGGGPQERCIQRGKGSMLRACRQEQPGSSNVVSCSLHGPCADGVVSKLYSQEAQTYKIWVCLFGRQRSRRLLIQLDLVNPATKTKQ